jgi:hypothetical protein
MRKIIVSIDDETYRRACIEAAAMGTSVSALVKRFLTELASDDGDHERLKREECALRSRISSFRGAGRVPRDEAHRRVG